MFKSSLHHFHPFIAVLVFIQSREYLILKCWKFCMLSKSISPEKIHACIFLSNSQNGTLNEPLFGLFDVLYKVLSKRGRWSSISKWRLEIWTKSLVSIFRRKPKAWNFRNCFSYDSFSRGFREIALSKLLLIKSLCQLWSDHCWIKIAWSDFKNTCWGDVCRLSSISFIWYQQMKEYLWNTKNLMSMSKYPILPNSDLIPSKMA